MQCGPYALRRDPWDEVWRREVGFDFVARADGPAVAFDPIEARAPGRDF
ncbi:hypothetical protein [Xanthobacter autotrophicus]